MERLADFSKMNPKERARQEVAALRIQAIQRGNVARAKVKRLMDEARTTTRSAPRRRRSGWRRG